MSSRIQTLPLGTAASATGGIGVLHRGIQIVRCRVCGRRLSAPQSVRAGIGPVCALGAKGRAAARLLGPLARIRIDRAEDPTAALKRLGVKSREIQNFDSETVREGISVISLVCENLGLGRPVQRPRLELAAPYVIGLNSILHENARAPGLNESRKAQAILYSLGALAHYLNVLGGLNEADVAHNVAGALTKAVDQVIDGSGLRVPFDAALRREMIEEQNHAQPLFDLPGLDSDTGPRTVTLTCRSK